MKYVALLESSGATRQSSFYFFLLFAAGRRARHGSKDGATLGPSRGVRRP